MLDYSNTSVEHEQGVQVHKTGWCYPTDDVLL